MNVCLQAHGEKLVYPIPPGLHELMSDISREVLRKQPENIYKFIAKYLESIHRLRETTKFVADYVNELVEISTKEVNFINKLGVTWEEANKAAFIIQNAYKNFKNKNLSKLQVKGVVQTSVLKVRASVLDYLKRNNLEFKEAEEACEIIQRAFRNYKNSKDLSEELMKVVPSDSFTESITCLEPVPVNKYKRDHNKLVYEESPQTSVLSTWSNMQLPRPLTMAYRFVADRPKSTSLIYNKLRTKSKVPRKSDKYDFHFFSPSGHLLSESSDMLHFISKENELLEEKNIAIMYPSVPEGFVDVDFTQDVNDVEDHVGDLTSNRTRDDIRTLEISSEEMTEESAKGTVSMASKADTETEARDKTVSIQKSVDATDDAMIEPTTNEELKRASQSSAPEVFEHGSKSSLNERSNIPDSELLERVSKSSRTKSQKSASEKSIKDTTEENVQRFSEDQPNPENQTEVLEDAPPEESPAEN